MISKGKGNRKVTRDAGSRSALTHSVKDEENKGPLSKKPERMLVRTVHPGAGMELLLFSGSKLGKE